MMTVREEQILCKLHEFIDANDINCAEDVTQRDSISEQCVDLVAEFGFFRGRYTNTQRRFFQMWC